MNLIEKIKLARGLENEEHAFEDGVKMKNATKIISAVVGGLALVLQYPPVANAIGAFVGQHANAALIIAGLTHILALVHNPSKVSQ